MDKHQNVPPETRDWITNKFLPVVTKETDKSGYLVTPYVNVFRHDVEEGNHEFLTIPRFSNGYATVQNRPGIVFETHMLKPYKDRVLGTKAMLTSIIKLFNENADKILKMNRDADEYVIEHYAKENNAYPLTLELTDKADTVNFKGFKHSYYESSISGSKIIKYSGEKYDIRIPYFNHTKVKDSVYVPEEYLIPQEWKELVDIMKLHGIKVETLDHSQKFRVEKYKFKNVSFPKWPYESRFLPKYDYDVIEKTVKVPEGIYVVKTSQRTLPVILHLLEPLGPDSFVKWGFFNAIFEQKEYFSDYSMEPIAAKMMKENPELKEEFEQKLKTNEKFRKNPRARLDFFYQRSPYSDEELNMYPVMKVVRKND
jgi:hypothetical protein